MVTEKQVMDALDGVLDPELRRSLVDLGMVRDVKINEQEVRFTLALTTLACPIKDKIEAEAREAVSTLEGVSNVEITMAEMTPEEKQKIGTGDAPQGHLAEHLNHVKRVVAVMSGKGGVGKSLVATLLASELRRQGDVVGVLDADITGPSIPKMLFPSGARPGQSPLGIIPAETSTGIKVMSINLLLANEDQAVIWRGPLISGAIQQFWGDVFWGDLDWLVVDLPPGTSDASLTVTQSLPLSGIVLVTSPQDLAGMVVRKAAGMAQRLSVPMLGLIENMSYFVCPDNGKRYDIFGPSHAEDTALRLGIPFLGRLPIDPQIARLCDTGRIEEYIAEPFTPMAERLRNTTPVARKPQMPLRK